MSVSVLLPGLPPVPEFPVVLRLLPGLELFLLFLPMIVICQCRVFRDGDVAFDIFASYIIGVVSDCFVGVAYDGGQGAVVSGGYDSSVVGATVQVCIQQEQVTGLWCVAIRICVIPCTAITVLWNCACGYSCVAQTEVSELGGPVVPIWVVCPCTVAGVAVRWSVRPLPLRS